jgi:mono/diheme cytochrome c family protein
MAGERSNDAAMKSRYLIASLVAAGSLAASLLPAGAQQTSTPPPAAAPAAALAAPATGGAEPVFDKAFLTSPESIKAGEAVWAGQCRHCHGNAAYPGKAPKLNPAMLEPDFIYDRVTNGFQKMPAWKDVFSQQDRMNVVAYIKSKEFSP